MNDNRDTDKRFIAVCGKGGTGKTVFIAMLTKLLLEVNPARRVLVIDADPAMGVVGALGVNVRRTVGEVREEIIAGVRGGDEEIKRRLADHLDYMLLEALQEMPGFSLLAMGHPDAVGCFCPVNDLLRDGIKTISAPFDAILIDGEAGIEQISRQVVRDVDTPIVLTDSSERGLRVAALIKEAVDKHKTISYKRMGVVVNRTSGEETRLREAVRDLGLEFFGQIPEDDNIREYDRMGKPILELPDSSPGFAAMRSIAERIGLEDTS